MRERAVAHIRKYPQSGVFAPIRNTGAMGRENVAIVLEALDAAVGGDAPDAGAVPFHPDVEWDISRYRRFRVFRTPAEALRTAGLEA